MMMSTMTNTAASNRRREDRNRVDGLATVRVLEAPFSELQHRTYVADLYDVSASGLRLACGELLDCCVLLINIELNGSAEIVPVRGEVLWASIEADSSFQMGIEFRGNDPAVIVKWHSLLKTLST